MATHIQQVKVTGARSKNIRTVLHDIDPRRGLDLGSPFDRLQPGYSPALVNWEPNERGMRPRSGLSTFYADTKSPSYTTLGGIFHHGFTASDVNGAQYAYFVQKSGNPDEPSTYDSVWFLSGDAPDWKSTSKWAGITWVSTNSYAIYDSTYIFDPGRAQNIGVITNNEDPPFYFDIGNADTRVLSDFTDSTLLDRAATCAAVDERLVFANVSGPDGTVGNRVLWTARGNPRNFTLAEGAGYQDINDARGPFVKIIADPDGMVLFTRTEIWRGRPRRDTFAFDFFRIAPQLGLLNPYTVVSSPFGIIFVGSDFEVYTLSGNALKPISRLPEGARSRLRRELRLSPETRRMHAVYAPEDKRYYLFYRAGLIDSTSDDFPKQCLMYDFPTDSWWFWNLPHEVHSATNLQQRWDFEDDTTWDDQGILHPQWREMDDIWDQTFLTRNDRNLLPLWAGGQAFHITADAPFDSGLSTGDSNDIHCEWFSHGHHVPGAFTFYNRLEELWIEYQQVGAAGPQDSKLTISGLRTRGETLSYTGAEPSGVSFLNIPIDDTNRTPQFNLDFTSHASSGTPTLIHMQAAVSNDGKYQGNV